MKTLLFKTEKEIDRAVKEFGFDSKEDLILQAVKEKIWELKKIKFFAISEKIKTGILKSGTTPNELLENFKS